MYLKQNSKICVMHAISPVHAGAGSATGAVDLPIQRERHSGWPHIQASGVKGAFRDHCRSVWMLRGVEKNNLVSKNDEKQAKELTNRIFGQSDNDGSQAGAVAFSDARLLAFPVRSNQAPFVWVTCPALLKRLARDLELVNLDNADLGAANISGDEYGLIKGDLSDDLILEDICLKQGSADFNGLAKTIDKLDENLDRLVLIPDHHFSFLMETATEIQAQIKIDPVSGTTKKGSLRYEELLPADSVLYSVVFFGAERTEETNKIQLEMLAQVVLEAADSHIQLGGDMTLGRGIFQLNWQQGGGK